MCYLTPTRLAVFTSNNTILLYSTLTFNCLSVTLLPAPAPLLHQLPDGKGLVMLLATPTLATPNTLFTLSPTAPQEVADALISNGEWLNALSYICRDYKTEILPIKTSQQRSTLKRQVSDILQSHQYFSATADPDLAYMADYITKYVQLGLNHVPKQEAESHYSMVFTVATHFCCYTNFYDLLYTTLHPKGAGLDSYHLSIITAILSNMLQYVNPNAMISLIDYAASNLSPSKLSRIILNIDVRVIPYDYLIRLTKQKDLTVAMAYIFTEGLGDYKTAVKESLSRDVGVALYVRERHTHT